jgi:hypothetical protein
MKCAWVISKSVGTRFCSAARSMIELAQLPSGQGKRRLGRWEDHKGIGGEGEGLSPITLG